MKLSSFPGCGTTKLKKKKTCKRNANDEKLKDGSFPSHTQSPLCGFTEYPVRLFFREVWQPGAQSSDTYKVYVFFCLQYPLPAHMCSLFSDLYPVKQHNTLLSEHFSADNNWQHGRLLHTWTRAFLCCLLSLWLAFLDTRAKAPVVRRHE